MDLAKLLPMNLLLVEFKFAWILQVVANEFVVGAKSSICMDVCKVVAHQLVIIGVQQYMCRGDLWKE
jgi:hypothetical protein